MLYIPRPQTLLPQFPDSHYRGPYKKLTVCWHHMCGAGTGDPISLSWAKQLQLNNYNWHRYRWNAIDILEGYDLYDVGGEACLMEGRPWWSNCDAFSGAGKIGYKYIGVEVDGNYMERRPSGTILEGAVETLVKLKREGKIQSVQSTGHRAFNHLSNYGHTNCPGDNFWARIPEINVEAERRLSQAQETGEEEELMEIALQPQPKQGNLYVWQAPDIFTHLDNPRLTADFLCWLNMYNESPSPIEIQIFGSPRLVEHPWTDEIPGFTRRGYDVYRLNGYQHFLGAIIVKASKNTIVPAITMMRLS